MLYDQYFIDESQKTMLLAKEMNLPRIILISILLLTFGVSANSQEPQQAVLVDEFEIEKCSVLRGRIDEFLRNIADSPGAKGIVITRDLPEKKVRSIVREELVKAQIEYRKFDASRISYVRTIHQGELKTEFWSLPNSATATEIRDRDDSYFLPGVTKPFLLLYDDEYNEGECYDLNEAQIVSYFLKGNPGSRSNIVIYASTIREARNREKKLLFALKSKYGIPTKRIRTFIKVTPRDPENPNPGEYWYLPPRQRRQLTN